jgi:hypothetical protein
MKSLVRSVTSALQLDRCDYQVRINGQEKKVITYSDVGRNTYSMRFILGKDTHNEPDDRPAIEFRRKDGEIVPVFRGTISRVQLMPIDDAELEKVWIALMSDLSRSKLLEPLLLVLWLWR